MSFMFHNWPTVNYDLKKNNNIGVLTNITLRFKINEILNSKSAVIYEYNVVNGERPDILAHKYYDDATLDWLILLTNNVIDPQFEWQLDDRSFDSYIIKKYGSVEAAMQGVHHYERILRAHKVLFDGTIIPERRVWVDKESYDNAPALPADPNIPEDAQPAFRRIVDNYTYELEKNQQRGIIKILDKRYVTNLISAYDNLIRDNS